MAIIKDCEIWFAKLDPKRPNSKFNNSNPTWECQIRTYLKEIKKEWEALNLIVKAIVPDTGEPYFRVNLRKKSIKRDMTPASPISVINGNLDPIDPNSIGHGSIGNVRIFQYEYDKMDKTKGIVSVLMGVQITKHIVYKPKSRGDEFEHTQTETIEPPEEIEDGDVQASAGNIKIPAEKVF